MLARLQLDPARRALISGFVDSYLRLTIEEEREFAEQLYGIMEIVTSWMEKGLEQGLERRLVLRMLRKRKPIPTANDQSVTPG